MLSLIWKNIFLWLLKKKEKTVRDKNRVTYSAAYQNIRAVGRWVKNVHLFFLKLNPTFGMWARKSRKMPFTANNLSAEACVIIKADLNCHKTVLSKLLFLRVKVVLVFFFFFFDFPPFLFFFFLLPDKCSSSCIPGEHWHPVESWGHPQSQRNGPQVSISSERNAPAAYQLEMPWITNWASLHRQQHTSVAARVTSSYNTYSVF